jgi:drug/metabolite transporter (DMT)-like permease
VSGYPYLLLLLDAAMAKLPITTIAILCAIGASLAFTLNDVGIKFASGDYALHQVILARATVAALLTIFIIMPIEGGFHHLKTKRLRLHMVRGGFVVMANTFFFMGIAVLPLSEATAIFFVAPMFITIFSVLFLGEKVGPWRWFAVVMGLVGVIIMFRPTPSTFQLAALLPVGAAACYATLHILTRVMGNTEKASTMAFYTQFMFVIFASIMGLIFGKGQINTGDSAILGFLLRPWVWPENTDMIIFAAIGFASAAGGYLITQAYKISEAAIIAPFEYIALVMAVCWGILFFDEWPDLISWAGISLILLSGLVMLWRERRVNKKVKRPLPRSRP